MKKVKTKRNPRVNIVKERQFKIRRWQCTTRKCTLCKQKFKLMKQLNDHVTKDHKCKYHHCRKSYSSKVLADHHIRHHSPGHYQCDKCSKMFHKKYTLEAHLNMHSDKRIPMYLSKMWQSVQITGGVKSSFAHTNSQRKKLHATCMKNI